MVVNKIGKMKVEGLGGFRHVDSSKKSSQHKGTDSTPFW